MSQTFDLGLLLALVAVIGGWLKLSRSRECAIEEAQRQCARHGLQLLDETVSLRSMRLRRRAGHRVLERCYGFEVSIDGDDREQGRLWMVTEGMSGLNLPTVRLGGTSIIEEIAVPAGNNVVPLRRPGGPSNS